MNLRALPSSAKLKDKRVLVRVDWNVPLHGLAPEESLKIERTIPTLKALAKRGAIVIVLTHLGRPEERDRKFSTERLLPLLATRYKLHPLYHSGRVSNAQERTELVAALKEAGPGSIHLLENVRFEAGEEKNDYRLAKSYAQIGQLFVNDAFASSHRAHVSVAGVAKQLPSYAGPLLIAEVQALTKLLDKPKRPFIAFVAGLKLSTKVPVIEALLKACDGVHIGGAMAVTFGLAKKWPAGKTFVEKSALATAKRLIQNPKLTLPSDVMVTTKLGIHPKLRRVDVADVGKGDLIVDAGTRTLAEWGKAIRGAKTILWNGPVGVSEIHACGAGSRFLARAIARRHASVFSVAGGGDTLPVLVETRTLGGFSFVSTGGGALLEFLAKKGKLPGLTPLLTS